MTQVVTAREANQHFSRLLAKAEAGMEIVITRRGRRVARLSPEHGSEPRRLSAAQRRALEESIAWARAPREAITEATQESFRDALHERP